MDVVSLSPLPVGSLVWQPRQGAWVLTVLCKGTFSLRPIESILAPSQEPVHADDTFAGDDPSRGVRAPNDLVPAKPRAEVMVVGHAYAPNRSPVRSVMARVVVGDVDKSIEVFSDRWFSLEGHLQEGQRFTRMPLSYDRAAGGPGTWNPVGLRRDVRDTYGRRALPNLIPHATYVSSMDDLIEPTGFGPIAASWPSRVEKLGWQAQSLGPKWLERPLPEGLDLGYFNQAPKDQLLSVLRDNERIVLENLSPDHARLVTSLPGIRPGAFLERGRGGPQRLALRADTLWIDTDEAVATITWRAQIPLERPDEMGRVLVGLETAAQEVTWPELERLAARNPSRPDAEEMMRPAAKPLGPSASRTLTASDIAALNLPALPFSPGSPKGAEPDRPKTSAGLPFQQSPSQPLWPPPSTPSNPASSTRPLDQLLAAPAVVPVAREPSFGPPLSPSSSPWGGNASPGGPPRETVGMSAAASAPAPVLEEPREPAAAPWSPPKRDLRVVKPEADEKQIKELLQLLWFEQKSLPRLRRTPAYKGILDALEERAPDKSLDEEGKDPWEVEDRREAFEILAKAKLVDAKDVPEKVEGAVLDDGKFAPPLAVMMGEMELPFDEIEALKAAVTTATPLIGAQDEGLKATVGITKELLQMPNLAASPSVAEGLYTRVKEAFLREKKSLAQDYLETQVERVLLSGRHYQKREVLGGTFLRFFLKTAGSDQPIVGYLPEEVGKKLPAFKRFRVRLIVEVHPQQDQFESQPHALKALAVARIGQSYEARKGG